MQFIPDFNIQTVFIEPWSTGLSDTLIILLMAFFVSTACGLIGNYIMLRKMSMLGDAISHSLLPGIALAYLISNSHAIIPLYIGATSSAILTVILVEIIKKNTKIKHDAAIGIVFSSLFAIGIIIITLFADQVDLDVECVLYGEIAFLPLLKPISLLGLNLGPYPLIQIASVCILLLLTIIFFYKQLLVSTFDPTLARILGINPTFFNYALTLTLSLVLVTSFQSVGAILVVGMLLFPGSTARLLTSNLKKIIILTLSLSAFYALAGIHLATWLDTSIAASITIVAFLLFLAVKFYKGQYSR